MSHVEKLDLRFLQNKTETFLVFSQTSNLRFTIVQNRFQQTNITRINHNNDNHIKFGFLYIFGRSGLLCRLGLESRLLLSCITYKRHTASKHCALVLAVWLASLLGWTLKEIYDSNQPSYLSAAWVPPTTACCC